MAASVPVFTFNNGVKVPSVGLGCWMGEPGKNEQTEIMVKTALKHGYRHFDTAAGYGNEEAVGKAIRESGIPREEVFVVTKVGSKGHNDLKGAFEISLEKLGLGYIDLWLMHWPIAEKNGKVLQPEESPTYVETWKAMEEVYKEGKVKSIGVSNFSVMTLEVLLKEATIVPATNQVHFTVSLNCILRTLKPIYSYCKTKNIILTAYSPLGQYNTPFFKDPALQEVAKAEGGSIGQVLISWAVKRGTIVVPKSEKEERIKKNIELLSLSAASMKIVDDLHKKPDSHRPLCTYFDENPGKVFGWTYDKFGWNLKWDAAKKGVYVA